ncbi:MAG: ABC transporter ATP-binding protein [Thermodesulfobacteriota bacterium]
MHIIKIQNLSHRFSGGSLGLDNVNLNIREGSFTVITGENGSGKTTLLKHLNGLLLPTSGSVTIAGKSVSTNLIESRQLVGFVFQNPDLQIIGETVFEDVAFGPRNLCLHPQEVQRRVHEALSDLNLLAMADRRPHLLSGGEKRRLAIAGVLAMNPRVLALDEPFSSLDYPGFKQVLEQILALHRKRHTIVLTSHDIEKVAVHAEHLVIMKNGKVALEGPPDHVIPELEHFGVRKPCPSRWGKPLESWLT